MVYSMPLENRKVPCDNVMAGFIVARSLDERRLKPSRHMTRSSSETGAGGREAEGYSGVLTSETRSFPLL